MRLVWTLVLALASGAAYAASPEDDYIAARDKAISAIAAMESANAPVETLDAANDKARADLEQRLSTLLGPFTVTDFPAAGTINIESLSSSDVGFGMLDGLRHGTEDGPSIVASTRGLVERWLQSRAAETDADLKLPTSFDRALKLDAFYTQAIGSDAAFTGTLDFKLKTPEGADMAIARLGGWAQDVGPNYDQEVVVTLVKGNSVMIAEAPATPPVPKIAACDAVWTAADAAAQKLVKQATGDSDETTSDAADAAWAKGDSDFRACMGKSLPDNPVFPTLLAQAQALADHMAGK
ncbi:MULTISPECIES: hypothetical protein [unclassified Mesorhizobium]|uniref:hypothetical protein n=1 Tax=unclassified Mesorhizobium TaxID=325217 RepID=UPI000FDCAF28|nr:MULTISPECIES: hypothetical protein [unclassified Mesorhizobium]TGR47250.1 hypothetical protein EN842_23105 [bacterium M00.F.Ca.ET.199.01.1.1]TGU36701.1 hypothetical protein EN799_13890 [bacterium M00.F.Ca.ET.156.01.1.1]TGV87888.1 hypothetical protein EN792_010135 [Mesorhizobium sp. M00.F.Ca.ET.149.01.1.1]TGR28962.1 hypothetical protein EN845_11385 [Mesorhizobium sp. M8A.F.Ca.ET.202.01.1.1]TGR29812.1 hypothetical protein EN840_08970 [Mesorhizobium sp. M8A.F.Ca.ET.197.01.1.1]